MFGKKMFYKRSVMITLVVISLMTLTAGVAGAHANNVKFDASGIVLAVGLDVGGEVTSNFKYRKNGDIKSIEVNTFGEGVVGLLTGVSCKKPGDACDDLTALLPGNGIVSIHDSKAKLKVTGQGTHPLGGFPIVTGTLKGKLGSTLIIGPLGGAPDLLGSTNLKIRSTAEASYACFDGANFYAITDCDGSGVMGYSPVLVPVELHIKDTGKFTASNADVTIGGKLTVIVDSELGIELVSTDPDVYGLVPVTTGSIEIKKGKATFAVDHDDHKKGPKD